MNKCKLFNGILLACLLISDSVYGQDQNQVLPQPPLNMETLKRDLSYLRGQTTSEGAWPRTICYQFEIYDFRTDTLKQEDKTFKMRKKPSRIIPHAVGVAEILWAICPRERLVAFNEFAADPAFCFLAPLVKAKGPIFNSKQTELVIGYQPDLVFTVFYSDAAFKEKLRQAKIPYFDLGYFGTINSIEKQIVLIGNIIGEERNAKALIELMDRKIGELKAKLPKSHKPKRVLYYDEGGYIPGKSSNFNSICEIIDATNVGAEQGIKSWSQIDFETLLKWDPDIIFVPQGSNLKEHLLANEMLSHLTATKNRKVFYIPGVYLRVDSQFLILSANLLAGIVYENEF